MNINITFLISGTFRKNSVREHYVIELGLFDNEQITAYFEAVFAKIFVCCLSLRDKLGNVKKNIMYY